MKNKKLPKAQTILVKDLNGFCIYPDYAEIKNFDLPTTDLTLYERYNLKEGIIFSLENENFKRIKCDVGCEDWRGYLKGFLYPNNKFGGHFFYINETFQGIEEKDIVNGEYKEIKNGYEIKGEWWFKGTRYGFYIYLSNIPFLNQAKASSAKNIKEPKIIQPKLKSTINDILNQDLIMKLQSKADRIKRRYNTDLYDHYSHVKRLHLEPKSSDNLIKAISIAYSWMPTMLHIHISEGVGIKDMLVAANKIGSIKSIDEFIKREEVIRESLIILAGAINHSIVGASKTLHIFSPETVPIIDSNVLKGWDKIFKSKYKKFPELKLNRGIPGKIEHQVAMYMAYWKMLLLWSKTAKIKNVRFFEEPFYWIGKE